MNNFNLISTPTTWAALSDEELAALSSVSSCMYGKQESSQETNV